MKLLDTITDTTLKNIFREISKELNKPIKNIDLYKLEYSKDGRNECERFMIKSVLRSLINAISVIISVFVDDKSCCEFNKNLMTELEHMIETTRRIVWIMDENNDYFK